jgi:hypothetical protein
MKSCKEKYIITINKGLKLSQYSCDFFACYVFDAGGEADDNEIIGVAILFSLGLVTCIIIVVSLVICRFRRLKRDLSTVTRVSKHKTENGARVAAEVVLTNSSDLHCCGHVTALVRDDHKLRPAQRDSMCLSHVVQ